MADAQERANTQPEVEIDLDDVKEQTSRLKKLYRKNQKNQI